MAFHFHARSQSYDRELQRATGSLARFENKFFLFFFENALAYYNAGVVAVNLKNRRIGSRIPLPRGSLETVPSIYQAASNVY
jgi:hypothetical protein